MLRGKGLHTGEACVVRFAAGEGATALSSGAVTATLDGLECVGASLATRATWPGGRAVSTVEHLFAAIAGAGAFEGLTIAIEGPEVPLMDGAAAAFFDAIVELVDTTRAPAWAWRVARSATLQIDDAVYVFAPGDATSLTVDVAYDVARFGRALSGTASWGGNSRDFRASIAPSRTFGAARDLEVLRAAGRATYVVEGSVVAVDVDDPRWAPRDSQEPVRHKLLDLIGDVASLGGPLVGSLHALLPSHRATHASLAIARRDGTLERVRREELK